MSAVAKLCAALAAIAAGTAAFGGSAAASEPRIVAACTATPPSAGERFSGPVLQVLDGHRLCVALGPTPDSWLEVRAVDLEPASADGRALLMAGAFSKRLECVVDHREGQAVAAVCHLDGSPLAAAVKAAAAGPEWRQWR